jgi:4-hydroxy 2-oxovalerate aldolase
MRLLDCSLRDGGYYNRWDFQTGLVRRYVSGLVSAGIATIELGFRSLETDGYLGALAHTTDIYLAGLDLPDTTTFGVMLNAKELVGFGAGPSAAIDRLFAPASDSPISLVRIAATQREVEGLTPAVERLHDLGYRTGVNLMQVHALSSDDLKNFGSWARSVGVEVAYFADSFGVLNPSDIGPIASALAEGFQGPIGCHLHDNRALAMANTLAAIDAGVTWVDGTIRGMGRGPGNAPTE